MNASSSSIGYWKCTIASHRIWCAKRKITANSRLLTIYLNAVNLRIYCTLCCIHSLPSLNAVRQVYYCGFALTHANTYTFIRKRCVHGAHTYIYAQAQQLHRSFTCKMKHSEIWAILLINNIQFILFDVCYLQFLITFFRQLKWIKLREKRLFAEKNINDSFLKKS